MTQVFDFIAGRLKVLLNDQNYKHDVVEAVLAEQSNTPAGAVVLAVGGGLSVVAYRVMKRIARLPTEIRVLR